MLFGQERGAPLIFREHDGDDRVADQRKTDRQIPIVVLERADG